MAYMKKVIWSDRRGRKHVGVAPMADDAIDCTNEATWRSDPVCQATNPGLFPTLTSSEEAQITIDQPGTTPAPASTPTAVTSPSSTPSGPAASLPTDAASPKTLMVAAAIAVGAYLLFGKRRKAGR